ncbi:MAG: TIGR00153 family protein [Thermodesulfobacteriota bacterium]
MMRSILSIFSKPPFAHLQQHMRKVKGCVDGVIPLIDTLLNEDYEGLEGEAKKIVKMEHEADIIKDNIRNELPSSIFMPVHRGDLLEVLSCQDDISDTAEDLAVLLTLRKMALPQELKPDLKMFLDKVIAVCHQAFTIIEEMDELVETSFRGREAKKVLNMIYELGTMEWKADEKQFELLKKIFDMEDKFKPIEIFMWMKIFGKIGDLANNAERMGNRLRLMLSK